MGEASIKPFLSFASLLSIFWSCSLKKKKANSLGLNAKRRSGPSHGAGKNGLLRFPENKTNDNGAYKLLLEHSLMDYLSKQLAVH